MFEIAQSTIETPGAKICVVGVGGGGGNVIKTMLEDHLQGVEFIVANTDRQALDNNPSGSKIYLGKSITKGLGAGANPEVGEQAALESEDEIRDMLTGHDMLFITAGMGGGTGTGAAPVISRIAQELGILTVGVVTRPFLFEGRKRAKNAERGIELLKSHVDTLIVIPNQKLLSIANEKTPLLETFRKADSILLQAVKSISDLINVEGLINLDFADIKTVMQSQGVALMGSGTGSGESRAVEAAQAAIKSPLLENVSIDGATGVIINITGNSNLTLWEVNEAASLISNAADESAEIIFGSVIDENIKDDEILITVVATGFQEKENHLSYSSHNTRPHSYNAEKINHGNTHIENIVQNFAKTNIASTPMKPTTGTGGQRFASETTPAGTTGTGEIASTRIAPTGEVAPAKKIASIDETALTRKTASTNETPLRETPLRETPLSQRQEFPEESIVNKFSSEKNSTPENSTRENSTSESSASENSASESSASAKMDPRNSLLEKAKAFDLESASHLGSNKEQLSMNLNDEIENNPIDTVKDIAKKVVKSPFKSGLDWASFKKKWMDLDK